MKNVITGLQSIGRALMLPIAVLPVAALLLRLGQADLLDMPAIAAAGDAIFSTLGLLFAIGVAVGLAKKEELVFTRDSEDPLALDPHGAALRLLQRIRDEAHRFALTFHRQSRRKRDLQSELDVVPGIGLRRRKTLLTAFGSLAGVRRATREELARVVGARVADAVIAHLAEQDYARPLRSVRAVDTYVPLGPAANLVLIDEQSILAAARSLAASARR